MNTILVTGGAGFIGSNFIRYLLSSAVGFSGRVINVDALTYAGNLMNLADLEGDSRYSFRKVDISDCAAVEALFCEYGIDTVVHFAAESHVDRSINDPESFIRTNIMGTWTLLDAARKAWGARKDVRFHHVSTDEVYGSLGPEGFFTEESCYDPRSPYSASKAGSDHLVMAWYHTYGLPVTISNCSNNYGPWQFPEKLVPLMIMNMAERKPLPVYGKGENVRDWLHVEDHCRGIWKVLTGGKSGRKYNFGGNAEMRNIDLVHLLAEITAEQTGRTAEEIHSSIRYVTDRPGHDMRYAIDANRVREELGWEPERSLKEGMAETVRWYLENRKWVEAVRSGEYRTWMETNYSGRLF